MGCSNPHPHCQIWASSYLPNNAARKEKTQKEYLAKTGTPLLVDYAQLELKEKKRIVVENEHWLAVVPFWALWPYVIWTAVGLYGVGSFSRVALIRKELTRIAGTRPWSSRSDTSSGSPI